MLGFNLICRNIKDSLVVDRIRKLWKNNVNYNQAQKQTPFSLRLPILSPPILRPLILRPPILWELIHCLENYPVFKVIACVQNYASVTPGSHRDINKLLPGHQIYTNINKAINRDINKLWAGRRCSSSGKDWRSWCSFCSSHLNHHGVNQTLFRMSKSVMSISFACYLISVETTYSSKDVLMVAWWNHYLPWPQ